MIRALDPQSLAQEFQGEAFHAVFLHSFLAQPSPEASFWGIDAGNVGVLHPLTGFCLYNPTGRHIAQWARWVLDQRISLIAGELTTHVALLQQLADLELENPPACRFEQQDFCLLHQLQSAANQVRTATEQELSQLAGLYDWAAQEDMVPRPVNRLQETLQRGRICYMAEEGRIVAAALTYHETPAAALIEGVYTLPAFRGKGYGNQCVATLCQQLQQAGKTPCLFYRQDNAAACSLYRKMGFQAYGAWIISEMHY